MKIAILTHNPNIHSQRRFSEAAKNRGHEIQFIQMSQCYMQVSSISPTVYHGSHETFEHLDAIIPRISPKHTFYGTAVLRQFEMMGVYALNSSLSIIWSRDKLRALQILARKHLPLPITGFADSPEESEKLIDVVGGAPLIVRLLEGTEGRGTIFAESHHAAISVINAFKQVKTNILVQEYIKEAHGSDIRCVVVGKKVITAIERKLTGKGPRDARDPTTSIPIEITLAENKMAIEAATALKLNLATVDLIRSNRGPLVLDVNCAPSIELLEKTTHCDIADPILQFIEEKLSSYD